MSQPETSATKVTRLEVALVALVGLYYLARLLYFAFSIAPGIPPDEPTHIGIIELYARAPLMIDDSPESYSFGLVTRVPFLYHLFLGKLTILNLFGISSTLFLRLINVALSMITIVVAYRLAQRIADGWPTRVLFLVMTTNTLMYTFISAVVSYDNLVNLFAVTSLAALLAFLRSGQPRDLAGWLVWTLLGSLTKLTFLPLALFLGLILLVERRGRIATDLLRLASEVRGGKPVPLVLALVALVCLFANLWLYGGNLLRYGKPVPECQQVLSVEACMENRIFARNWIVTRYRDGATSFDEALQATGAIRHTGDRDHAIRLLRNELAYKQSNPDLLPVLDYMGLIWSRGMRPSIFGVQAHVSMLKTPSALLLYNVILLAAFLLWIRGCSWGGAGRTWVYLGCLALGYFIFLVGIFNYRGYLVSHAPFLGVQGRYVFPVLVPAYLVASRFLLAPFRRTIQVALLVAISTVFVYGDLPYFLRHAGNAWFARSDPAVSRRIDAGSYCPESQGSPIRRCSFSIFRRISGMDCPPPACPSKRS